MDIKEDMSLWEPALKGKSAAARTKHFASSKHRASHTFDTEHVWTFHIWQQFIDFSDYELSLGLTSYDLPQHLDGQPMQVRLQPWKLHRRACGRCGSGQHSRMCKAGTSTELHDRYSHTIVIHTLCNTGIVSQQRLKMPSSDKGCLAD